jgi:two-component system response regulator NreC
MNKKITLLICDDHAVFREGVKTILKNHPTIEVIGEAGDGREAVELTRNLQPAVVLMDISLPVLKGFEATRRIRRTHPAIQVLILTIYDDDDLVARCLTAGAAGYVVKDAHPADLVNAIQTVARGERYLSPTVLRGVVDAFLMRPETRTKYDLLSDREREILVLLAQGETLKDIAQRLNLSVKTVDAHKVNLMRKLELHDRAELIRYAIRKKLVET